MENVRYRVANDKFEKNSYYVDTGFMYLEHDLTTGEVRNVSESYNEDAQGDNRAIEYPGQKPLAITAGQGSRSASVIMPVNDPVQVADDPRIVRRSTVIPEREGSVIIPSKKEGSVILTRKEAPVIMPRREGSVILTRNEGSVIMPRREGSVILTRKEGSVINGSVIGGSVRYPAERIVQRRIVTPTERFALPPRERVMPGPRYIQGPTAHPQTVRVIQSSNGYAPTVNPIPEGRRVVYVVDDSQHPGRYATQRVVNRNDDIERHHRDNIHKLYKTTINVGSSDSDSNSDVPKEVIKTRYINSANNRFKNVKGVPIAKMYVPTPAGPSKNSNSDSENSSLDSVDIKRFEKDSKKSKRYQKRK